jgi:tetratricopeptide (TPR) repeat protein
LVEIEFGGEIVSDNLQIVEVVDAAVDRLDRQDDLELRQSRQLEFLLTVLQSISDSSADPKVVYPLFHQHLDLLEDGIIEMLRNWAISEFAKVDIDSRMTIAAHIIDFGNLINQFSLENHILKTALSIACYDLALKVFTVSKNPESWGIIQNNLANAYADRIDGDISENLEQAIEYCCSAMKVYSAESFPYEWAMVQNNLAITYSNRIKGDRAENLEQAIEYYRSAMKVYSAESFPYKWAMVQNNLAITYSNRIKGDRAENLEQAIEYYRSVMKVYSAESFPYEWARTQVGLAKFSIEQLQNYQFATEHLQFAYAQLSENNNDTGLLAQTMFELARCFHKTGSLGQAKLYFKDSIRLYQRLEQPTQVAAVTSALGNLELQMGAIDDARIHLQTALEFYQAAGNLERVASIQELQQYLPEYSPELAI